MPARSGADAACKTGDANCGRNQGCARRRRLAKRQGQHVEVVAAGCGGGDGRVAARRANWRARHGVRGWAEPSRHSVRMGRRRRKRSCRGRRRFGAQRGERLQPRAFKAAVAVVAALGVLQARVVSHAVTGPAGGGAGGEGRDGEGGGGRGNGGMAGVTDAGIPWRELQESGGRSRARESHSPELKRPHSASDEV
eukprot:scaffold6687_cov98-Isochrysis_galbana.AAC.3